MKVIIDHQRPFALAHGGFQIQIEATKRALEGLGVDVEYARWWDGNQRSDIIHFFGTAPVDYIEQARMKSTRVIQTPLFTETCNRSDLRLRLQGAVTQTILALPFGNGVKRQLTWESFRRCDMNVAGLKAECKVLDLVFKVRSDQIAKVPLGLSDEFLSVAPVRSRGEMLICVGTITQRKNPALLAKIAREAKVPILFVGKPYSEADPYWREFTELIDGRFVRYQSHVESKGELIELYRSSRGFAIMSRYENWCLAAHEAAACGLPVLLPRQKWSCETFGNQASYWPDSTALANIQQLRAFYEGSSSSPIPNIKFYSWNDVGHQLIQIYEGLLRTSR